MQTFPPLGQEYEPFLYAIVCDERNGMPLTVVSAIARSGADPWREAARIAKLPKTVALEALSRMIPNRDDAQNSAIANRLFALLPAARQNTSVRAKCDATSWKPLLLGVLAMLVCVVLASAFRTAPQSDAGKQQPVSSAPLVDRVDP